MVEVPRRALGKSALNVPLLALGTVKIGRNTGLKLPSFELPSDAAVQDLLATARDVGVNLIDTAPAYGSSEERLGALLPGHRQDWLLCSKVGEAFDGESSIWDFSPAQVSASVTSSLRRLRTDYLDIVLVHSDGSDADIVERYGTLEQLAELKAKGLIRAIGLSSKSAAGGLRALPYVDVIMATLNAEDRSEADLIEQASAQGVGVLVKKPLGSGRLPISSLAQRSLNTPKKPTSNTTKSQRGSSNSFSANT